MNQLGILLLPPGWDTSPMLAPPCHPLEFHFQTVLFGTHLYSWVVDIVIGKCFAQEHSKTSWSAPKPEPLHQSSPLPEGHQSLTGNDVKKQENNRLIV